MKIKTDYDNLPLYSKILIYIVWVTFSSLLIFYGLSEFFGKEKHLNDFFKVSGIIAVFSISPFFRK